MELRDGEVGEGAGETVADTGAPRSRGEDRQLDRGETVGRYVILQKVGAGGMGVVYAAYDPELDRKVALKRLRADRLKQDALSKGRSRLLREAQSMARLSHPNVVAVHDVGIHDDRVFLAMEYVEGRTLAAVAKENPRPEWDEVLRRYVAAGRGVEAAHAAGLVHRDFKPENVLLGDDGAVKVTDFGLAREGSEASGVAARRATDSQQVLERSTTTGGSHVTSSDAPLTQTGAVLGTPAYMAPEQHLGLTADERSDQFSFCVSLFEGLYGLRPFEGKTSASLAMAITEGKIRAAPAGTRVPHRVHQAIVRGLAGDPEARFANMGELLDALSVTPQGTRRRLWGSVVLLAVVAGGVGLSLVGPRDELCSDMDRHLDGIWDDAARTRIRDALDASGVGFADSTFERVGTGLDEYTLSWTEQRSEACEDTRVRGDQSQAAMELRMACLDDRLDAVRSVVEIMSKADVTTAQNAVAAVGALPSLSRCADLTALRKAVEPPDPGVANDVASLRYVLAQARAHASAGQYASGLDLAGAASEQARTTEYAPVIAEALYQRGNLEHEVGEHEAAEATLEESFFTAVRAGLHDTAARAAAGLVTLVGQTGARHDEGRKWAAHAMAHADVLDDNLLRATATHALASVAHKQGAFDEARSLAARSLEIRKTELGPRHEALLSTLNLLGLIASDTGDFEEARANMQRGLELGREILGPDHPDLARFLNNLAKIEWMQGHLEQAEELFQQALDLQAAALGPSHANVAQLHNNLAAIAASRNDMDEAERRFELALEIWIRALGPDHPSVADGLNNLAVVASGRGDYHKAREYDERALDIRQRTMEPDHPSLAQAYNNLGEDLRNLGDLDGALELHRKALSIWEAKLGGEHDDVALALTAVGTGLVQLDRPGEALPLLERALEIRAGLEIDEVERAHTKWALARALWDVPSSEGGDRSRARQLAAAAKAAYEAGGETKELPALRTWLDTRG